ncbi:hypothetical protein ACTFIU_002201 [Dictyostelium citrinum]
MTCCGLSEATLLLGEINDWINLKERVEQMNQFDNKEAVIDKFIESANDNPDTKWLNQIVEFRQQSGCTVLTDDMHVRSEGEIFPWPRVNGESIPNGFVSCPVLLKEFQKEYNSTIYSDHFGSKLLDNNSKSIPSLDWFIVTKDIKKSKNFQIYNIFKKLK